MGIYFRDILLIRISRGANNCGQHLLEKNSYFTMRFSPHFQLFYFNDRLEFCEFFEWKIKRINNADLFSQPPLLIFIKGANISGGDCICRWTLTGPKQLGFTWLSRHHFLKDQWVSNMIIRLLRNVCSQKLYFHCSSEEECSSQASTTSQMFWGMFVCSSLNNFCIASHYMFR